MSSSGSKSGEEPLAAGSDDADGKASSEDGPGKAAGDDTAGGAGRTEWADDTGASESFKAGMPHCNLLN